MTGPERRRRWSDGDRREIVAAAFAPGAIVADCITNNAAERALRGVCLGRKAWLFCGSDRGGQRAAVMYSLIGTAKLNNVDPQAWLADILARIADYPASPLDDLLPWNWAKPKSALAA
jgi:hypothetical protein